MKQPMRALSRCANKPCHCPYPPALQNVVAILEEFAKSEDLAQFEKARAKALEKPCCTIS